MQTCSWEFLHWTLLLVGSKVQSCSSGSSECPTSTTQYSTDYSTQHRTDRLQVEEELQAAQCRQVVAVLLQSCLETRLNYSTVYTYTVFSSHLVCESDRLPAQRDVCPGVVLTNTKWTVDNSLFNKYESTG